MESFLNDFFSDTLTIVSVILGVVGVIWSGSNYKKINDINQKFSTDGSENNVTNNNGDGNKVDNSSGNYSGNNCSNINSPNAKSEYLNTNFSRYFVKK